MPNKLDKSMMNSPYYAGYNKGKANHSQYPYPAAGAKSYAPPMRSPYRQQGAVKSSVAPQVRTLPLTLKERRKLKRAQKRNRNYFFVMRRGISFVMFVCFFLYIAAFAISFVNLSPVNGFVSLFTLPDNTSYEERWAEEAETGVYYVDKSDFISVGDPIMGFIDWIKVKMGTDTQAAVAEETEGTEETAEESQEPVQEEITKQYYGDYLRIMEDRQSDFDITPKIAYLLFQYFPVALAIAALTGLIAMITSFGAARGRRIYKGFALASFIMVIAGVITLAAGYALSNVIYSNPLGAFDFTNIQSFLLRGVTGPPYGSAEALATPYLQLVSGFLLLAMLILPLVTLILSVFCRKKVSYKIFDK